MDSGKQVGNPKTEAFASLSRIFKHLQNDWPKSSVQSYSSPFEKLSNQGQTGWVPLDWAMLGTINQGMENSTKVILGCLMDSPRMVFSMVSIDHLKRVRVKVSVLEWGRQNFFFSNASFSFLLLPYARDVVRKRALNSFNWIVDHTPVIQHKQLSSLTPEINRDSLSPTQRMPLSPIPWSTLHCSPLPFQTLPPFSKCLRLMEIWGCKGPQRPSCPTLLSLPAPVLRVIPIWGTDLQLRETNACYSPCSLLCPYSAMATYSATCANNSPAQGINMANSIANLRLKAKEYSLQRNQVPTVNWGKK